MATSSVCRSDFLKMLIPSSFYFLFHMATWVSVILSDLCFTFSLHLIPVFISPFLAHRFLSQRWCGPFCWGMPGFLGNGFAWVGYRNQLALAGVSTGACFSSHGFSCSAHLPVECVPQKLHPHAPPPCSHRHAVLTSICCLNCVCVLIPSVFQSLFISLRL